MPDDHEIFDNWEPTAAPPLAGAVEDSEAAKALAASRAAFLAVFGGGDRDGGDRARAGGQLRNGQRNGGRAKDGSDESRLWFHTCVDGHPLFMLDTRTARSHRDPARIHDATIIDERQARRLEAWLRRGRKHPGPRFIASPSMPLPRRRLPPDEYPAGVLRFDAWDGYPRSLHRLLAFIARHRLQRLVFVSGDEHLSCVARIEIESDEGETLATLHSVHCSALYAPWPFANSRPQDFVASERFEIEQPDTDPAQRLWCRVVQTDFVPMSSGFARIAAERQQGNWMLNCEFYDGTREGASPVQLRYPLGATGA